jgi:hypothetical protein
MSEFKGQTAPESGTSEPATPTFEELSAEATSNVRNGLKADVARCGERTL